MWTIKKFFTIGLEAIASKSDRTLRSPGLTPRNKGHRDSHGAIGRSMRSDAEKGSSSNRMIDLVPSV